MLPALLSSTIAYGFLLSEELPGFWFVHALVLYPVMMWTMIGNLRVFIKYFPWNLKTIWFYKFLRLYHILFFTGLTAAGNVLKKGDQITPATIAYFTTTLVLINQLFAAVTAKAREIWKIEKEKKASENEFPLK